MEVIAVGNQKVWMRLKIQLYLASTSSVILLGIAKQYIICLLLFIHNSLINSRIIRPQNSKKITDCISVFLKSYIRLMQTQNLMIINIGKDGYAKIVMYNIYFRTLRVGLYHSICGMHRMLQ